VTADDSMDVVLLSLLFLGVAFSLGTYTYTSSGICFCVEILASSDEKPAKS